jgi:hypothetical protein
VPWLLLGRDWVARNDDPQIRRVEWKLRNLGEATPHRKADMLIDGIRHPTFSNCAWRCSARVQPPKLREAQFADYANIARLASRYDMAPEPWERWRDLWGANPAHDPGIPIGWVLESGGEIVGWFGNIRLHYEISGELVRTASPRSWVVDEPFRSYATLLAEAFFNQKYVDLILSILGRNEKSNAAFASVGGTAVPQQIQPEAAFWVTDCPGVADAYLRFKRLGGRRVLKHMVAAALRLRDAAHWPLPTGVPIQRCVGFDHEFDDFWHNIRRCRPSVLVGRRTRAALHWHFGAALRGGRAWLYTCRGRSGITAYSVFLRSDNSSIGLRRAILADFQDLENTTTALPCMLGSAMRDGSREGIHMIEIRASRLQETEIVHKLSPFKRRIARPAYSYKASKWLEPLLHEGASWDITFFDGDSSLSPAVCDPH